MQSSLDMRSARTHRPLSSILVGVLWLVARAAPAVSQEGAAIAHPAPARSQGSAAVAPASERPAQRLLPGEREFHDCLRLPRNRPIRVSLKPDSEITDVIAWISSATCKGFIVATGLQLQGRKVNVLAPEAISAAEAYRLFLALLETVQLTVEPAGRFLRVIESTKSPRALLPIYGIGERPGRDEGIVTQLVKLNHAGAAEIALVLQGYRGEQGAITAHPPSTLILTDRAATLERLFVLIAALDLPGERLSLWTLTVRHLSANDLGQTLAELSGITLGAGVSARKAGVAAAGPAAAASPAQIASTGIARLMPDDRAGRLLVVATDAAFARLAALAAKLDVPAETRAAKVHTYRCRHADCDAVASMLGSLAGIAVARGPAPEGTKRSAAAAPAVPGPERGLAAPIFAGDVRVTSDPSTNALLVLSSYDDFRTLRRLVEEVDVPRQQVFIEAMIMEVVRAKSRDVSIGYHGGALASRGALVGGFNAGKTALLDQNSLGSALVGLSGLAVGAPLDGIASALGIPTDSVPSLGAFIQLLQQDKDVDLIANPHLLITNNHEGEISVGQRVPVPGAFTANIGGGNLPGLVPSVSINREDVALRLKLTPHVNEDGLIRLEIDQEMSELGPVDPNLGVSTTRRTTKTTVFARDQQTIVIGGLMRERQTESVSKVPLLGDIPLIGVLFRSSSKAVEKQNIIIALTPYVVSEPRDLTRVLEAKLRERREFLRLYGSDDDRRLLAGPLGPLRSIGMLERINRAAKEQDASGNAPSAVTGEAPTAALPASGPEAARGLPLPGS